MWANGTGNETDLAVGQSRVRGIFALDGVDDLGGAERDEDIVMTVPVHQCLGMRKNVDVEDADLIVGQRQVDGEVSAVISTSCALVREGCVAGAG